jgi:hypothetical protein
LPGLYLDLENGALTPGTNIVAATLSSSDTQLWNFTSDKFIVNKASGLALDVSGGNVVSGNPVVVWTKKALASAANQLWVYNSTDGTITPNSKNTLALDVPNTVSGTRITLYYRKAPPTPTDNQQWTGV